MDKHKKLLKKRTKRNKRREGVRTNSSEALKGRQRADYVDQVYRHLKDKAAKMQAQDEVRANQMTDAYNQKVIYGG